MAKLAPENEAPGIVKDHAFAPSDHNQFLCDEMVTRRFMNGDDVLELGWTKCNLAEAAHDRSRRSYRPNKDLAFRCPDCVMKNIDPCEHGPA